MDFDGYISSYAHRHEVFWAGGIPWGRYKRSLRPLTPPHVEPKFGAGEIQKLLKTSKSPMAMWTYNFDSSASNWWWIIAERPYDFESLHYKTRYNIRHGLKICEVKIISGQLLADYGYDCYKTAMLRHSQTVPLDEATFREGMPTYDSNKAYMIWGIFTDNNMIGYAIYKIIDNIVYEGDTIFDPSFFKYHSSYALIHTTANFYLNERNCLYITGGWRSLSHETNYQNFTIEKFKRRKVYCKLGLAYSPLMRLCTKAIHYSKPAWTRVSLPSYLKNKLNTLCSLESLAK